jgi:para-nitrobenzyl esterase
VRQGAARGVDVLAGWNRDEMRLFQSAIPPEMQAMLPEPDLGPLAAAAGTTAAELRATYEQERPDESPADLALAVQTDQSFGMPTIALAEAVAANGGRSWLYRFDWRTPVMDGTLGACHVLEQPFAFDWDLPIFTGDDPPTVLRKAMHGAWLSFARTGDPNGEGLPAWPEYDDAQRTTMLYDDPPHVVDDPSGAVRQLWAQGRGSG